MRGRLEVLEKGRKSETEDSEKVLKEESGREE